MSMVPTEIFEPAHRTRAGPVPGSPAVAIREV